MLKTIEEVSSTKKRLKIEIPSQTIEKEISLSLEKLRQRTRISGFRVGKAPLNLIEKKFGKEVEGEVLQKLIPKVYSETIKEAQLKPVDNPVFEEMGDFKRQEPFNITLLVEVMPGIEGLNYTGIKVPDADTEVKDSDMEDVLSRIREEKAIVEPSEEPLKEGDIAILDYTVDGEEKTFESQVFKVGGPSMPAEFSRGLTGKKKGEKLEITVNFPEDYPVKETAGKEVLFHITLKDTKKVKLAALDDELAKDLGHATFEELKAHIKTEVGKSKKLAAGKIQKAEIMKKLIESHNFEAPEGLVEKELTGMVEERTAQKQAPGSAQGEEAGSQEDLRAVREGLRVEAVRNVKARLLLDVIGEREKVEVSEDDINEKVVQIAQRLSISPENVVKYYVSRHGSLDSLRHAVFEEKVLDMLLEKAQFEKVEK